MTARAPRPGDSGASPGKAALAAAACALGEPLTEPRDLGGSDRSLVLRARVAGHDGRAVVIKQLLPRADGGPTVGAAEGCARELVGLRELDATPGLLAHDDANRLLVMTDVGPWPTLANLLLAPGTPEDRDQA